MILRWIDSEVLKGRLLAVEARAAHDRFGLTHTGIVRETRSIRKTIPSSVQAYDLTHRSDRQIAYPMDRARKAPPANLHHDTGEQGILNLLNLEDTPLATRAFAIERSRGACSRSFCHHTYP